jgi:autotransporter-associated beta strand protein
MVNSGGITIATSGGAQDCLMQGPAISNAGINTNGNTLTFNLTRGTAANDLVASAPIWNGGGVALTGNGILQVTAADTYTGTTMISGGTLLVGNGGSLSPDSPIVVNATLAFSHSDNIAQGTQFTGNPITGTGGVVQLGPGTVTLGGGNLYSGGTTIAGGVLQVGNASSLGTGGLAASGGTLDLNGVNLIVGDLSGAAGVITSFNGPATLTVGTSNSTVFSGTVTDSGTNQVSLTKNGAGALTLLGGNTFSGITMVNGGTLALGNGVETGQIESPVALSNNSTFVVNCRDEVDLAAMISGTGSLVMLGAGILTLEGTDTYTGATIVRNGILLALNNDAIADGTNLTVGNPAMFSEIVPASAATAIATPTTTAVPEPDSATLALLAASVIGGALAQKVRYSKYEIRNKSESPSSNV